MDWDRLYGWMSEHAEAVAYVTVGISLLLGYLIWFG